MTEPELRALVRDVIARHVRTRGQRQESIPGSTTLFGADMPVTGCSCCLQAPIATDPA